VSGTRPGAGDGAEHAGCGGGKSGRSQPGTRTPEQIGIQVLGGPPGRRFSECSHVVGNPFNNSFANQSTAGILTTYSNPGTVLGIVGLRAFPLKGHELNGYYGYRGMVNAKVLNVAFGPERRARGIGGIRTGEYHEIGGFWLWTLNPSFDIRLTGNIAFAAGGYRDLAELSVCGRLPGGGIPAGQTYATAGRCTGKNAALHSELRFRARF
jgi:hypothetical protein